MIKRVGLTGGIGSGKSEVARILESLGAFIIDTDFLARQAVAPNSDGLRAIARMWPGVVRGGGLDRSALAEIVFTNPDAREQLNAIVHPFVRQLANEKEQHAKDGQVVIHMVPLLFETGYNGQTEASVLVIAPDQDRIARVMRRDKLSEDQVRARMSAQIDPQKARLLATHCIENDGDLKHLNERTAAVYDLLRRTAKE
ncbi:MAG: dephospho-CoA kinase [Candidatus Eremiobacteraeota bacterium]|nr:dephospho-CoA kinase [Candidatus Eremiobacteraeota bacterium]